MKKIEALFAPFQGVKNGVEIASLHEERLSDGSVVHYIRIEKVDFSPVSTRDSYEVFSKLREMIAVARGDFFRTLTEEQAAEEQAAEG